MEQYLFNLYLSNYDDEDRILSKSKIDEIAEEISYEITKEIDSQFEVACR